MAMEPGEVGRLLDELDAAIRAAEHLKEADRAAIAAARLMARQIEMMADEATADTRGKVVYVGPHFKAVLDALVLTPRARIDAALDQEEARGKLADMRSRRRNDAA